MTPDLTSISAARLKAIRLLLNKKYRLETGTCLIEGRRFVAEALARPGRVEALLLTHHAAESSEGGTLAREAVREGVPVYSLTEKQLDGVSDTVSSQGILAIIRLPGVEPGDILRQAGGATTLVALDGVSDPGNIGTIIRTCAWFGVGGIFLSERSVELSNPKLLRSTMGAVFTLPVASGVDLAAIIPILKRDGFRVMAADAGGEPARSALRGALKRVLVFGSEAHGLSGEVRALADTVFGIPGSGAVESLNVAVAVGISLEIAASGVKPGRDPA
jgi:RNA methyltransferase, TrmH family